MSTLDEQHDHESAFMDPLIEKAKGRVGQTLHSKWHLDVVLGVGGMAAVYAATHRNGSRAAVKILHTELSASGDLRTRFMREGYAANAVGHDGAVKVIDDDVAEDGSLYLVTELLDGETLEDRRARKGGRLSEEEVLNVADQLLEVLAAAHAKGVIHRDIKPANIFLLRSGQIKVLDFGIARLRELSTASLATKSGSAMGTPAFMSPEQARGLWDEVDGQSDLWSVGATMWHALTAKLVHEGRTTNEELLSAMTNPSPPVSSVLPSVSPAVALVVDRALAFEKDRRWRDAEHMREGVQRAYQDRHSAPITTAPRPVVPESVPNRTLSSASTVISMHPPTTARPVASSQRTIAAPGPSGRLVAAAAMGVVATGLVASAVIWVASASHGSASPAGSNLSQAVAAQGPREPARPAATAEPTTSEAPAPPVAAPDTASEPATALARSQPPLAPKAATPQAQAAAPVPRVSAPPPTPGKGAPPPEARKNCSPPYEIDPATGKKHFKVECL